MDQFFFREIFRLEDHWRLIQLAQPVGYIVEKFLDSRSGNAGYREDTDSLRFEFIFQPLNRIFPLRVYDIHLVGCDHLRPFGDIRVIGL